MQALTPSTILPIGDTLAEGWRLFLKSIAVVFLPLWLAGLVDVLPSVFTGGGLLTGSVSWWTLVVTVIAWLVESIIFGSAIAKLDACATNSDLSYIHALRIGMHAAPALLIGDLLYNLAAWGGVILFIVPGIILGTTLAFFAYAAVLDHKRTFDALAYSHKLAWPDWWRTSIVISSPAIVLFVYDVIAGWPDIMSALREVISGQMPSTNSLINPWYDLGLMPLVGAIVWCYVLAVCYIQYIRLKKRAENH